MNKLKSVIAAATLMLALVVPTEGQTPECKPGETSTPPCASAAATSEDPAVLLGQTDTPPAVQNLEIGSLVDLALYALFLA